MADKIIKNSKLDTFLSKLATKLATIFWRKAETTQVSIDNTPTANSNNLVKSSGVYSEVHPAIVTTQPQGGFLSNVVYDLGTLTGTITFSLAAISDATIANAYFWTFEAGSTAPTITWPANITWAGGAAPTISASKHYEIMIRNGYGTYIEI